MILGKLWPFSLISMVFRVFSFAFIVTMLRYYAIPVYAVLILVAICIGTKANTNHESFVLSGIKSLLFTGRHHQDNIHMTFFCFQHMKLMNPRRGPLTLKSRWKKTKVRLRFFPHIE